jgi:hypothetical protein
MPEYSSRKSTIVERARFGAGSMRTHTLQYEDTTKAVYHNYCITALQLHYSGTVVPRDLDCAPAMTKTHICTYEVTHITSYIYIHIYIT